MKRVMMHEKEMNKSSWSLVLQKTLQVQLGCVYHLSHE